MQHGDSDNLCCTLLTPAGVGAIAVVRITGSSAWSLARSLVKPRKGELPAQPDSNRLYFGEFGCDGESLDDVIVATTRSRAGLAVDISSHGGIRIVERIVMALVGRGARWAEREPVERAAHEWRPSLGDLAFALLPTAKTRRGALFLIEQATSLPQRLEELLRASESGEPRSSLNELSELLAASRGAECLYAGADVALVGPPNVGKSLLANRLAGRDGAIVFDGAGTTRDWVRIETAIDGIPVNFIDTAGVRITEDAIESAAIHGGQRRSAAAHLFLLVLDASAAALPDMSTWAQLPQSDTIVVWNKTDLQAAPQTRLPDPLRGLRIAEVSALTGAGLDGLTDAIADALAPRNRPDSGTPAVVFCPVLRAALERMAASGVLTESAIADAVRLAWESHR